MPINSLFSLSSWTEENLPGFLPQQPLAKASVCYEGTQEIAGKFQGEYLLQYSHYNQEDPHLSEATYVGYLLFTGSLHGKQGTFIVEEKGIFANGLPQSQLTIKKGSGMEQLTGITGSGSYGSAEEGLIFSLDYIIVE
ncbi:DUF3224 domain-containing protein [Enterococcus sp. LJL99]